MAKSTRMDAAGLSRLLGDWAEDGVALPESLAAAIGELIESNLIPTGTTLPPQRELAAALQVSRGTVTSAMASLEAGEYIQSVQGSGSRVRGGHVGRFIGEGRMVPFTNAPPGVTDLSTGALPASDVAAEALMMNAPELDEYLSTDGYFPEGLPTLRQAVADLLTSDGIPTSVSEILITSGAQHATWLALNDLVSPGDLALVEEPTYRGGLAVLRTLAARIEGIRFTDSGLDVALASAAMRRHPTVLYCQTSIHNPTGQTMRADARKALADAVNANGLVTVEDVCSYDLTLQGAPASMLAGLVDPTLLVTVGTLSKLFWGGIRVGWVRADENRIKRFVERRKINDLASSIFDQLYAIRMLTRTGEARIERREMLVSNLATTEAVIRDVFPNWTWSPIRGGSGLWVDTGTDATALAEIGKREKVKLLAGPGFSAYGGCRTMLKLPIWHQEDQLRRGLETLASAVNAF